MYCEYGHGRCTAPDTKCIHWMETFCELDEANEELNALRRAKNSLCGDCKKFNNCNQTVFNMTKCLAKKEGYYSNRSKTEEET